MVWFFFNRDVESEPSERDSFFFLLIEYYSKSFRLWLPLVIFGSSCAISSTTINRRNNVREWTINVRRRKCNTRGFWTHRGLRRGGFGVLVDRRVPPVLRVRRWLYKHNGSGRHGRLIVFRASATAWQT